MGGAVYWHAEPGDDIRARWSSTDPEMVVVKISGRGVAEDLTIFMSPGQARALRDAAGVMVREHDRAVAGELAAPPCDMADGCGAAAGRVCEPGCPSWASDDAPVG